MSFTIEVDDLTQAYERGKPVLTGLSIRVAPGEVVGLLGRNGAGKTTLLRTLAGIMAAQSGTVAVFGRDPFVDAVEVKRRLGYVAEDQAIPAYLRVEQVVDLHRSLFSSWDEAFAQQLAARFDIDPKKRITDMSKGQARRVALLCAVAHRPELLLLDEPAGGLDPAARREFLETAIELLGDAGSTIVFSSHYMADVERIASRVVLVEDGAVLIDEDLDALREEYVLAMTTGVSDAQISRLASLDACVRVRRSGDAVHAVFRDNVEGIRAKFAPITNGAVVECRRIPLEDLFVEIVGGAR